MQSEKDMTYLDVTLEPELRNNPCRVIEQTLQYFWLYSPNNLIRSTRYVS
jgi:hypothetical protein